jgi:ribosome biogenesis protein ENP2
LIQEFDMPAVSSTVKMSPDGQYIYATGIYKPRVKCFDVNNLSLKFERCFDSESITFEILSDDYSKVIFYSRHQTKKAILQLSTFSGGLPSM